MVISGVSGSRENVTSTIKSAASATGGDFGYLFRQAQIESGLNPNAKASTSSALGLFQFTSDTWLNTVRKHGAAHGLGDAAQALEAGTMSAAQKSQLLNLRRDPELSTRFAAEFAADNAKTLAAAGHTSLGPTELYMAHFLGAGGATKFLDGLKRNPDAPAATVLPAAADANETIFYSGNRPTSFREIYQRFASKFEGLGPVPPSVRAIAEAVTKPVSAAAVAVAEVVQKPAMRIAPTEVLRTTRAPLQPVPEAGPAVPAAVSADAMSGFLVSTSRWEDGKAFVPVENGSGSRDASEAARSF